MAIEKAGLNVVIFEDEDHALAKIYAQLSKIDAKIVGEAKTLPQAFKVLELLINKTIVADVILLDGNLEHTWGDPVFDIRLPPIANNAINKGLFARLKAKKGERIVVNPYNYGIGARDAIVISEIIKKAGLALKTVGVSRDKLQQFGIDIDIDLTKANLDQLAERLEELS